MSHIAIAHTTITCSSLSFNRFFFFFIFNNWNIACMCIHRTQNESFELGLKILLISSYVNIAPCINQTAVMQGESFYLKRKNLSSKKAYSDFAFNDVPTILTRLITTAIKSNCRTKAATLLRLTLLLYVSISIYILYMCTTVEDDTWKPVHVVCGSLTFLRPDPVHWNPLKLPREIVLARETRDVCGELNARGVSDNVLWTKLPIYTGRLRRGA